MPLGAAVVGVAALSVLTCGTVAAASLEPAATPRELRVTSTDVAAPAPVTIAFPAAPDAPAAAPSAAPVGEPVPPAPQGAAPPPADPLCSGDGWQQRRGERALGRLLRPRDAEAVRVSFRAARRDVLGLAHLESRHVEVFVRSCERQSDQLLLHVLAHELGHLVDATRMTDALRAQWLQARGIPAGTPWFGCDGCTDFATPAGDFAETYAQWQRRATTNRSELAPAPTRAELERLAERFF